MPVSSTSPIKILLDLGINLDNLSDDEDYLSALIEATNALTITNPSDARIKVLQDEIRKVRAERKKTSPSSGMKSTKKRVSVPALLGKGVNSKTTSVSATKLLSGTGPTATGSSGFNLGESLVKIAESVTSIAQILREKDKLSKKEAAFDRRAEENERRKLQKENLKKRFAKMAAVAQKIIQPVRSILDKIINYFAMIFLGRIAVKLWKWFSDPENKRKVAAVGRFLGDHGPKLFGLWIAFGTGFGKAIRVLLRVVGKGIAKLIAATGKLAVAAGLKKFGGLSKFGGKWGKALGMAAEVGGTLWAMNAIDNAFKGDEGEDTQKLPGFSGGGLFTSGLSNIFKRFNSKSSGDIVPGSGTGDTVSAMLTPGEAVLQVGARERQIEATGIDPLSFNIGPNANKPQIVDGTMFAATGGLVGSESGSFRVPPWKDVGAQVLKGLGDIGLPGFGGGHTVGKELSYWKSHIPGGSNTSGGSGFDMSPIQDVVNAVKNDQRVKEVGAVVNKGLDAAKQLRQRITDFAIEGGYLNKEGKFEGAVRPQAFNFISDLLPTLPGISHANKFQTEMYLASIGLSRERAAVGHQASQGMLTGGSGIDRAHMVGALQVNKMSDEAEGYYMNKIRARLAAGTLKSGDMIDAYDLPKNSPIRREQGSVRFYVGPNGKPYLLDTYGFDPGNVDLGAQQAEYDKTVKKFQSGQGMVGRIAKMFDIKPMSDAMEGGEKVQLLLGIRNKLMGYDPRAEMEKGHDSKRLKTKAQVEELSGLGDLSHLIEPVKTAKIAPQQKPKTAPLPPPESFANTGTGRDGTFGEGTYGEGIPSDPSVSTPSVPNMIVQPFSSLYKTLVQGWG